MASSSLDSARGKSGVAPLVSAMVKRLYRKLVPLKPEDFVSSHHYWTTRYGRGGDSGPGSYGRLAYFKAGVINEFIEKNEIRTVVEFGSGDGAQLELAKYPRYTGVDISPRAIELCKARFRADGTKEFLLADDPRADSVRADLALSLDVIYHLTEDDTFEKYMHKLAAAGEKFLCIYSSDYDACTPAPHIRHRGFSDWLKRNAPNWKLVATVRNPYPDDPADPDNTTWADFSFFARERNTDA